MSQILIGSIKKIDEIIHEIIENSINLFVFGLGLVPCKFSGLVTLYEYSVILYEYLMTLYECLVTLYKCSVTLHKCLVTLYIRLVTFSNWKI